jgi:hypothetical protein
MLNDNRATLCSRGLSLYPGVRCLGQHQSFTLSTLSLNTTTSASRPRSRLSNMMLSGVHELLDLRRAQDLPVWGHDGVLHARHRH